MEFLYEGKNELLYLMVISISQENIALFHDSFQFYIVRDSQ